GLDPTEDHGGANYSPLVIGKPADRGVHQGTGARGDPAGTGDRCGGRLVEPFVFKFAERAHGSPRPLRPRDRIRRCWRWLCRRTSRRLAEQITVDLFRLFPCLPFRRDDFLDRVLRGEVVFGWFQADADDKPQLVEITPALGLACEFCCLALVARTNTTRGLQHGLLRLA